MIIRDAQISVLEEDVVARFDRSLAAHLQQYAPRETKALDEAGLLAIVRAGRQRAADFDFTSRESIRLYLELMFLFGSGFATDPQYPWAARALARDFAMQDQRQRAGTLHSLAIRYLHTVWGEKREFISMAMQRLTLHRLRDLLDSGPAPDSLAGKLNAIYPEKCAYMGKERMLQLIQQANRLAAENGLAGAGARALSTVLVFLLGHETDRDPIRPWVASILRDTASLEPAARTEVLENRVWEEFRNGMG